jgi:hypothetical protein
MYFYLKCIVYDKLLKPRQSFLITLYINKLCLTCSAYLYEGLCYFKELNIVLSWAFFCVDTTLQSAAECLRCTRGWLPHVQIPTVNNATCAVPNPLMTSTSTIACLWNSYVLLFYSRDKLCCVYIGW